MQAASALSIKIGEFFSLLVSSSYAFNMCFT